MAFYRNYSNETVPEGLVDKKGQGQSIEKVHNSVRNEDVDVILSDKDFEIKMEGQYRSDGEADDVGKLQEDAAADDGGLSNVQPSTRRMALAGRWGSTFWKDCQPTPLASESGQESKSSSGYKNEEESEDDSLGGREESEDPDKVLRVHADVPVDEMSSDEYYEQDGDEPSDLVHHRVENSSIGLNSNPKSRPVATNKYVSRNSKASDDDDEYDDNDVDYEDDDDDEDGNCN